MIQTNAQIISRLTEEITEYAKRFSAGTDVGFAPPLRTGANDIAQMGEFEYMEWLAKSENSALLPNNLNVNDIYEQMTLRPQYRGRVGAFASPSQEMKQWVGNIDQELKRRITSGEHSFIKGNRTSWHSMEAEGFERLRETIRPKMYLHIEPEELMKAIPDYKSLVQFDDLLRKKGYQQQWKVPFGDINEMMVRKEAMVFFSTGTPSAQAEFATVREAIQEFFGDKLKTKFSFGFDTDYGSFNKFLSQYIDLARQGQLDISKLDELFNALSPTQQGPLIEEKMPSPEALTEKMAVDSAQEQFKEVSPAGQPVDETIETLSPEEFKQTALDVDRGQENLIKTNIENSTPESLKPPEPEIPVKSNVPASDEKQILETMENKPGSTIPLEPSAEIPTQPPSTPTPPPPPPTPPIRPPISPPTGSEGSVNPPGSPPIPPSTPPNTPSGPPSPGTPSNPAPPGGPNGPGGPNSPSGPAGPGGSSLSDMFREDWKNNKWFRRAVKGGVIILGTNLLIKGATGALKGALKVLHETDKFMTKISMRDFGNGRSLTTEMAGTERQRALARIQQNKQGARSFLGMEAQLMSR